MHDGKTIRRRKKQRFEVIVAKNFPKLMRHEITDKAQTTPAG